MIEQHTSQPRDRCGSSFARRALPERRDRSPRSQAMASALAQHPVRVGAVAMLTTSDQAHQATSIKWRQGSKIGP